MKRIYFLFLLVALSGMVYSQQVPRNYVLVEIATGTWCGYCPGAALAADDLIENGDPAAIIENHYNDDFQNADSYARIKNYYDISAYPTANFDGSYDTVVWGHPDTSVYYLYKPIVDARIDIDSDFTLDIFGENDGDDYSIMLRLQDVGGYDGDNIKLRLALTESDIEYYWQGLTELNFVSRRMIPNHNGTDLSEYDLTEITDIELDFTFNNSWDDQHCELVVFLQDDDTQEVLQSNKIGLTDLYMPIIVDFTADVTTGCDGTVVNFTDLCVGEGDITYEWTFDGGTPETSSEQNPTITYNSGGNFNVELTATDDHTTDTKTIGSYIEISETPEQADIPEGESQVCNGTATEYSVPYVQFADEWEWEITPEDAGTMTVNDNSATLNPAEDWTGDFTLKVRASNYCGIGEWSDDFEGTIYQSPELFLLEGGGGYCQDTEGAEILLSASETGIDYLLIYNDTSTGIQIAGTGEGISFGMVTDTGYYTVEAFNDNCSVEMSNQVEVYVFFLPETPEMPSGETLVCNDQTETYSVSETDYSDNYLWVLEPAEAGTVSGENTEIEIDWNEDFSGTANLSVTGINDCGEGDYSENLEIQVDNCTDINNISDENDFNIYPNPATDKLFIEYPSKIKEDGKVYIFNQLGQLMIDKKLSNFKGNKKIIIDLSPLQEGIYIVRYTTIDGLKISKKFIKN